ncbi:T9SS type A sorting domain-containing protein [Nibribacter ruber]|uniref:T9SS type A sorting domain-containing protein n=1 Tax=Nibribacter ruber TaxID=2698458 RepID=A0A6P1P363_9BACT|nr:T9SS type A sorting domain-containing protein [Nibribacter ruber]QHL88830.1 T9SS type A sorting domain-containing protein [Nibribacter ruber]
MKKSLSVLLALAVLFIFDANAQNTLIPFGSSWQYLDNGTDQGMAWISTSFNSSTWKTGSAKFGYGVEGINTQIGFGPDKSKKYVTTYFRKSISITDPASLGDFTANIRLDDGAVIYVNGVEVHRINMPTGPIAYNTLSAVSSSGDGSKTLTFQVNSAPFVSGTNVIVVEIHQSKVNTSDMAFDMELSSSLYGPDGDLVSPYVVSIERLSPSSEITEPGAVTFRTIFSEPVNGVTPDDFTAIATGSVEATVTDVSSENGTHYDATVNASGEGTLRLDLMAPDTDITDLSSNALAGDYTSGESYTLVEPVPLANALFSFNSSWKYLDNGTDQSTAWRTTSFSDAAWKTGVGKFGYGITDAATLVGYGPNAKNKYITTYFRKSLSITDVSNYTSFKVNIKMDDGVVVYVNGTEVYRNNMPTGSIAYNTLAALSSSGDGTKIQSFTISNGAFINGPNVIAVEVHQSKANTSDMAFDMELLADQSDPGPVGDVTSPMVTSINRQSPTTASIMPGSVTFRVSFSEKVTGVSVNDFVFTTTGTAGGTLTGLTAVGTDGTVYDLSANTAGEGTVRLDLKASGTEIMDASSNPIASGFTAGESYLLQTPTSGGGFATVASITPMSISTNTADKPQSKVWTYAGKFWTVLPTTDGTFLWRLDGTTWTKVLLVSSGALARADCKVVGNLAHVLLFRGNNNSYLISLEYDAAAAAYKLWSSRPTRSSFVLGPDAETATLDIDGNGRMWVAYDTPDSVNVRYSDSPYTTWSEPIVIESGIADDDICAIVALPTQNKMAVLWSNQRTDFFGMRTHTTGDSATTWSEDESPGSQTALNVGTGFSDDHMNMVLASDGTLYCAVKTSYETPGYTKLALLVRRPNGVWDNPYEITQENGTRPIVILNEAAGKLRIVYTSQENGGDILYKESSLDAISFGSPIYLIRGMYNYVSSTKATYTGETVLMATDVSTTAWKAIGFLVSDGSSTATAMANGSLLKEHGQNLRAYPNPFKGTATVNFTLPQGGAYTIVLYNSKGEQVIDAKKGLAEAGVANTLEVSAAGLPSGLYILRLETNLGTETIKLLHNR